MGFTKEQKQAFIKLYDAAVLCKDTDTMLVKIKDDMIELLMKANEAKIKHVPCKSMVPHPKNRGGSKMQYHKIYSKGSKIVSVGVSLTKCGPDAAVCFEDDPLTKAIAKAWVPHSKTSKHFANFEEDVIEYGSVGCGHWNQFLCCIADGCEVPKSFQASLCEPGRTKLDEDRLCRSQPLLRQLLRDGLRATCIKSSVEKTFPMLPNILQKALNVEHHIGEGTVLFDDDVMYKQGASVGEVAFDIQIEYNQNQPKVYR